MTGLSLALANLKPGTGKTTSAVWLAHIFVQAGNSVLLVDADPSGSALEWADLAAMDPRLAPPQAAFPFRVVALPSRDLHRRLPEIAQADDVVIIDTPQLEDHAAIALSALRYADEIVIPCAPNPIEINRTTPVRDEIAEMEPVRDRPARSAILRCVAGGMTRSSVPTTAQLGMLFQAAVSVPAVFAPSVIGRWLATISHRSASGRSCAKASWIVDGLRNASASPSGAPG